MHRYMGNDYATTLLLGVFTRRNLVENFIRLKMNFIQTKKTKKSLFEPTFRGLRGNVRTPSIARWKAHGRLFIHHNVFRYLIRFRCYKWIFDEDGIFRREWITLSAYFRLKEVSRNQLFKAGQAS